MVKVLERIDTIDPAYYTVAHGNGQTTTSRDASVDVGGHPGPAAECRASVLLAPEPDPRRSGLRWVRRDALSAILRRRAGASGPAPGRYFRLLLLGYFEGLDSERGIAWRAADSLSVRSFLGLELHEAPPDHSTVSRTRRLINLETHQAVFTWVLQRVGVEFVGIRHRSIFGSREPGVPREVVAMA